MGNIKRIVICMVYAFFRFLPIKKDTVLLFSYYGEQYSGSPKYIGEYLLKNTDMDVVWAFVQPQNHRGLLGRTVRYGRLRYYFELATAKTIITNYRMTSEFKKRKGQIYIQTWHSSLRLKRIEKDAAETLPAEYVHMAQRDSDQIDFLLSGSQKSKEIFENAFWYEGAIAKTGTPQCDILYNSDACLVKKVRKFFEIPDDGHIVLYAPTFRKDYDLSVYDLDVEALRQTLRKRFGGEWYVLMRLHPHLVNLSGNFRYSKYILQATKYDDVQELLCAADFLISDYSAIMFDYMVTKKPCMLYTPDLKDYTRKDRKLYFKLEDLPFQCFINQVDLLRAIEEYDADQYKEKLENFLNIIGSYEDGKACERVCELIRSVKR